jgi:hypothetical protein
MQAGVLLLGWYTRCKFNLTTLNLGATRPGERQFGCNLGLCSGGELVVHHGPIPNNAFLY